MITSPMRSRGPFRSLMVALTAALTALTLALPVAVSSADTEEKLDAARDELRDLEDQLTADSVEADQVEAQLGSLKDAVEQAQARYQELEVLLDRTENEVDAAESEYDEVQRQLNQIIAEAYMGGTAEMVSFIMDAESQMDLSARLDLLSAVAVANANMADRATQLATNLEERSDDISFLMKSKAEVLEALARDKEALKLAVEQHEQAVADLERTQANVFDLIDQLKRKLRLEDIQYLQQAFHGEKSLPYGQWAGLFLDEIGAPDCRDNLVVMVAWQLNEGTSADWNPLATTYYLPGSGTFNSYSVRDYPSLASGLKATRLTLQKGSSTYLYKPIIANLRRCADAMKTAEAINRSSWCRGCTYGRYVTGLIDRVADDYNFYAKL